MEKLFGERLRSIRRNRNINQSDFAKALGVSERALQNYETGERDPKLGFVRECADFLNVSVAYLMGETDENNEVDNSPGSKYINGKSDVETEVTRLERELSSDPEALLAFYNYKDLSPEEKRSVLELILEYKRKKDNEQA